ncbi:MAG: DUF6531 domain-containing protein, partial [Thermoleophilia bacterium]
MSATIVPDNHFKTGGHLRRLFLCLASLSFLLFSLLTIFSPSALADTSVSGLISGNVTWNTTDMPYIIHGGAEIAAGSSLTIPAGVVVKGYDSGAGLLVSGTLNATGATFTSINDNGGSNNPQPGDWAGVSFNSGGGSLNGCHVFYAGSNNGAGVSIGSGSSPTISGTIINKSGSYGIYVSSGHPIITGSVISNGSSDGLRSDIYLASLASNEFTNNNGSAVFMPGIGGTDVTDNTYSGNKINGMYLFGDVTQNTTWPASNSPYVIQGFHGGLIGNKSMEIRSGFTLTIDSGAIIKFYIRDPGTSHNTDTSLTVWGGLIADNAVFTSLNDDSHNANPDVHTNNDPLTAGPPSRGDWGGIGFESTATNSLTNSTVSYGGSYGSAQISIGNSSAPTITGNAICYSAATGILGTWGHPTINYNDIFANAGDGVANTPGAPQIDARHNFWGSKHGPRPYGIGNGFSGPVTATPFSRIPFTAAGAAYQATLGLDDYCAYCGDPINTATGAFVYQHKDIEIPTKGLPLEFDRTYNSNDLSDGLLGYGWSFSWQISVSPLANGNVVVLRGDGRQDTFTLNADGSYSPPAGRHDALSLSAADGTFRLLTQQQVIYNFDSDNALVSEVSETGQTTAFAYNSNKQLTTITEPAGRTLSISWGTDPAQVNFNRIDHITDALNHSVTFGYSATADGGADLTSVTDQNNHTTVYHYDNHRLTGITDAEGHTSANNTYDASGRVTDQRDAENHLLSFAYAPGQTTMTRQMDPLDASRDEVTTFYYDSQFRLTRQTDSLGKDTLYSYDGYG